MSSRHTNPALRSTERWLSASLVVASLGAGGIGIHLAQQHTTSQQPTAQATPPAVTAPATDTTVADDSDEAALSSESADGDESSDTNTVADSAAATVQSQSSAVTPVAPVQTTVQQPVSSTKAS